MDCNAQPFSLFDNGIVGIDGGGDGAVDGIVDGTIDGTVDGTVDVEKIHEFSLLSEICHWIMKNRKIIF